MMNVLVLNGSPKGEHSNTLKLTNAFLDGILQADSADIHMVDINEQNLHECTGCFSCWGKTPGVCIFQDDMAGLLQKILWADVIVLSFPLYCFSLPAGLKNFIDRQLPLDLPFMEPGAEGGSHPTRYPMEDKRYVLISTCGFYTAEGNYDAVNAQFDRLWGKDCYTTLYCGQGELFRVPELQKSTDEYLRYVKLAGTEFVKGSISEKTREKLNQPLFPREIFEAMADASWGIEPEAYASSQGAEGQIPKEAPAVTPEASAVSSTVKQGESNTIHPALIFTRQMAALYNKSAWKGHDVILEFFYTDVNQTYQLVLGKDGHKVLTDNFLPCTTRIETPLEVWRKIGSGQLDGQQAMMDRLYRVTGDFNLMLHWDEYFGWDAEPEPTASSPESKKTNMNLMLLPWITIWVLLSIHGFWGGISGIVLCGILPFGFLKYKPTVFEAISIFSVTTISLLSVLGYPDDLLIPVSYLLFGLMWFVTIFLKVPLSAWYSMNRYGEEKALHNPLFIQTNRILTACWGVLYLLTPLWTYPLLQTPLAPLTGLFNSALPAAMGVFTLWFQRWYPRHYASGR